MAFGIRSILFVTATVAILLSCLQLYLNKQVMIVVGGGSGMEPERGPLPGEEKNIIRRFSYQIFDYGTGGRVFCVEGDFGNSEMPWCSMTNGRLRISGVDMNIPRAGEIQVYFSKNGDRPSRLHADKEKSFWNSNLSFKDFESLCLDLKNDTTSDNDDPPER
jgi:hypothetical protein